MLASRKLKKFWIRFWMRFSHLMGIGKIATYFASLVMPPYYGCVALAKLNSNGYVSPSAIIHHKGLNKHKHCFMGDRVTIYEDGSDSEIELGEGVHLHKDTTIQTGPGVKVIIGQDTHIQPRCQISAYVESIIIGSGVEIAPNCAFYSYNHSIAPNQPIRKQKLVSKGSIVVEDEVWIGYGAVLLDGVNIGQGAVIAAGSIVKDNVPENAIVAGVPAKVVGSRNKLN